MSDPLPRKYSFMGSYSPYLWCMIPLIKCDDFTVKSIERLYISRLRPALNYLPKERRRRRTKYRPPIRIRRKEIPKLTQSIISTVLDHPSGPPTPPPTPFNLPPPLQQCSTYYSRGKLFMSLISAIHFNTIHFPDDPIHISITSKSFDFTNFTTLLRKYKNVNIRAHLPRILPPTNPEKFLNTSISKHFQDDSFFGPLSGIIKSYNPQTQYFSVSFSDNSTHLVSLSEIQHHYLLNLFKKSDHKRRFNSYKFPLHSYVKTYSQIPSRSLITITTPRTLWKYDLLFRKFLYHLATHRTDAYTFFRPLPPRELMRFYITANNLPDKKLRSNLHHYILNFLHRKYNVRPRFSKLTIKIPFHYYPRQYISSLIKYTIARSNLPPFITRFIYNNTRVVFPRRKNIADLLCNNIQQQKHFSQHDKPQCTCHLIRRWTGFRTPINDTNSCPDHFCFSASALPAHLQILNTNSKNIPCPSLHTTTHELQQAFSDYLMTLRSFHSSPEPNHPSSARSIHSYIRDSNPIQPRRFQQQNIPTLEFLSHTKNALGNTIITYPDKDNNRLRFCCPIVAWQRHKQLFFDDTEHYSHSSHSRTFILSLFPKFLSMARLTDRFRIPKRHDLSYCYYLDKAKDTTRSRPLVSYYHHPLKKLFNYASRALTLVLQSCKVQSSVLWRTKDLVNEINSTRRQLVSTYQSNTKLMMFCADIKNMYTELPQDIIIKSIQFMFHNIKQLRKYRKYRKISIPRSKQGKAFFGYSQNYRSFITLSFQDIINITTFDIRSVYFTSLGTILHQFKGSPMGSPGSSSYAICTCMYYEHQFYHSVYDSQKLSPHLPSDSLIIRAKRYVDDVLGFIAYDSERPITRRIAENLITTLKNAYHPDMIFKDVPVVNNQTCFLETSVSIHNNNHIDVFHHDKNFHHLLTHPTPKTLSIMDAQSFSPLSQPRNNILNTLHRIHQNSSNNYNIITSSLGYLSTILSHHYTFRHFLSALNRIGRTTGNPVWRCIKILLRPLYTEDNNRTS